MKLVNKSSRSSKKKDEKNTPMWVRFKIPVLSMEMIEVCKGKLESAIIFGAKRGNEFVVGFNSVCRAVEKSKENPIYFICAAKEKGSKMLLDLLVETSLINKIPLLLWPDMSENLKELFKLKSISCICFRIPEMSENGVRSGLKYKEKDNIQLAACLDELKDTLLQYSFT